MKQKNIVLPLLWVILAGFSLAQSATTPRMPYNTTPDGPYVCCNGVIATFTTPPAGTVFSSVPGDCDCDTLTYLRSDNTAGLAEWVLSCDDENNDSLGCCRGGVHHYRWVDVFKCTVDGEVTGTFSINRHEEFSYTCWETFSEGINAPDPIATLTVNGVENASEEIIGCAPLDLTVSVESPCDLKIPMTLHHQDGRETPIQLGPGGVPSTTLSPGVYVVEMDGSDSFCLESVFQPITVLESISIVADPAEYDCDTETVTFSVVGGDETVDWSVSYGDNRVIQTPDNTSQITLRVSNLGGQTLDVEAFHSPRTHPPTGQECIGSFSYELLPTHPRHCNHPALTPTPAGWQPVAANTLIDLVTVKYIGGEQLPGPHCDVIVHPRGGVNVYSRLNTYEALRWENPAAALYLRYSIDPNIDIITDSSDECGGGLQGGNLTAEHWDGYAVGFDLSWSPINALSFGVTAEASYETREFSSEYWSDLGRDGEDGKWLYGQVTLERIDVEKVHIQGQMYKDTYSVRECGHQNSHPSPGNYSPEPIRDINETILVSDVDGLTRGTVYRWHLHESICSVCCD